MTHTTFEPFSIIPNLLKSTAFFNGFSKIRCLFISLFKRNSWTLRNEFYKIIHFHKGKSQYSPYIFDCCTSRHCSKSTDLRHLISAIFFSHIFHHLITTVIRKINIDIWHGNSFWIQKSLKKKLISHRINIRNSQKISN